MSQVKDGMRWIMASQKSTIMKVVLGRRFANAEVLFVGGEEGKWTKPNHFCSVAIR